MPIVSRLSIAPVKGLALEHPDEIELTGQGVREDRRFFLVDDTGRLIDGLLAGRLVQVKAHIDPDGSHLRMTFPDGTVVEDDVRPTEPMITRMYGRMVLGHLVDGPCRQGDRARGARPRPRIVEMAHRPRHLSLIHI